MSQQTYLIAKGVRTIIPKGLGRVIGTGKVTRLTGAESALVQRVGSYRRSSFLANDGGWAVKPSFRTKTTGLHVDSPNARTARLRTRSENNLTGKGKAALVATGGVGAAGATYAYKKGKKP